jgi:hypothetical protein
LKKSKRKNSKNRTRKISKFLIAKFPNSIAKFLNLETKETFARRKDCKLPMILGRWQDFVQEFAGQNKSAATAVPSAACEALLEP